jgi:starch-binding outer membrane protein, SusD/RagB family
MKKNILFIIITLFILFSCNDEEFLDKKPHTPTDYSFYTSESGAIQGINAAYDILQLGEQVGRVELSGIVCSGDAMAGGEPGGNDQPSLQEMMRFGTITTNTFCFNYWNAMYRGIYRCNLVLYYLKDPIDGFSETLRNRIMGEAYFLRGLFHFKLQINYGGYPQIQSSFGGQLKGVPFVDRVLKKEEWNQTRPELTETWSKIEADFARAAELLPLKDQVGTSDIGRATKGAAQAMLAKTYLYQEKWQQAYETAKVVIESGKYRLIGDDGETYPITRSSKNGNVTVQVPGYKWMWQPEANNNDESIFDVQHQQDGSSVFPEGQEGNLLPRYYGVRAVMAWSVTSSKDTVFGSVENFWGFILPTKYFVNTAYKDVQCVDGDGNILDPRFKFSVIGSDDLIPFHYTDADLRAKFPDSVNISPYYNNPATGYATWKYFTDPYYDLRRVTLGDMPQNTKYFRYADLLLIGAEAAVNAGHTADALTWINMVRERARKS